MLDKADRSPIRSISISGYWDGPLSGWIRVDGQYYWFNCIDDEHYWRVYNVYWIAKEHKLPYLNRVRQFRSMVGWHQTRYPGRARTYFKGSHQDQSFKDFYNLPSLPRILDLNLDYRQIKHVGITDLKTEVVWLLDKESYDRDWNYKD